MPQIELDTAKPCNFSEIDKFYDNNLNAIIKLDSPTPSTRTVSSTSSIAREINRRENRSDSSTDSDSEQEEKLELDAISTKNQFLKYQGTHASENLFPNDDNVIVVNSADNNLGQANSPRIESIAIQNSSDIQFGNKTFYNGPVTIKQFLLDDKNKKWISRSKDDVAQIENGVTNKAFDGPANSTNTSDVKRDTTEDNAKHQSSFKLGNFTISRKHAFVALLTTICLFITIILLTIYLNYGDHLHLQSTLGDGDDSRKNIAINSTIGSDLLPGKVLRIISRDEWLAQPPNNELDNLVLPVKRVIITHTATEPCDTQAACTLRVRLMQTYHMESRSWDDIAYNFLVGGDGAVYEGRGWDKQGAHTKGYNKGSIGVAYIGTFNKILPNEKQLTAGFELFNEGVKLHKLVPDYKIYAHRQLIASESPGSAFFEEIKKWNHWTNEPPQDI